MRGLLVAAIVSLGVAIGALPAQAAPFTLGPTSVASGLSPWAPGCGGPGEASAGSVLYQNAEVETHVAVNPTNANNVVAYWQQDRWSDGGAHGNLAGYSVDGGLTWAFSAPRFSRCSGGAGLGNAGDYQRATDPWLSFGPNGRLHAIGLVFDNSTPRNAVLAAFSDNGGATWSTPRIVQFDNPRALGNNFNDKETLTADPFNANLVYATWQRIVSPSPRASQKGYENAFTWFSEAYFARSTNGGVSWEPARAIWRERGRHMQAIGNQVEVLPDGTLINGFNMIRAISNRHGLRGYSVALVRSTDKGVTWSDDEIVVNRLLSDEVTDPDDGHDVPVVFALLAGGAPFQLERLESRETLFSVADNVYVETSSYGRRALELCLASLGREHLVYGSDTPVIDSRPTLRALADLGDAVTKTVCETNPARLLP